MREITGEVARPYPRVPSQYDDKLAEKPTEKPVRLSKKRRSRKKKESLAGHKGNVDTSPSTANLDGRHYHLDLNAVPFIVGGSTAPSYNVKSNVQNVKERSLFRLSPKIEVFR